MPTLEEATLRLKIDATGMAAQARQAEGALNSVSGAAGRATGTMDRLGKNLLTVAAAYGAYRVIKDWTGAAMQQEAAELKLVSALTRTGNATVENVAKYKRVASEIQALTTYEDDFIIGQMAMAANMGVSSAALDEAAVAAVGLAERYGVDLATGMRLISRAQAGHTAELTRYGIVLGRNLGPQGKFNELLRVGAEGFQLARDRADSTSGRLQQLHNTIGDTKEALASGFLLPMKTTFETLNLWLQENQSDFERWSGNVRGAVQTVAESAIALGQWSVSPLLTEKAPSIAQDRYRREMSARGTPDDKAFTTEFKSYGFGGGFVATPPRDKAVYERILAETKADIKSIENQWDTGIKSIEERRKEALTGKYNMPAWGGGGAAAGDDGAKESSSVRAYLDDMKFESEVLQMTNSEREKAVALRKLDNVAAKDLAEGLEWSTDEMAANRREMEGYLSAIDVQKVAAFTGSIEDEIAVLQQQAEAMRLGRDEYERTIILQDLLTKAEQAGIPVTEELVESMKKKANALQEVSKNLQEGGYGDDFFAGFAGGIKDAQKELISMGQLGVNVGKSLREGLVHSISDAVFEAKDFGDAMEGVTRSIAKMVFEWAVNKAIITSLNMLFPTPVAASAKGNIFEHGDVVPFASGALIDRPITFPLRGGRMGLAGEAGPEVIMPAKHGTDGGYAVTAYGAAGQMLDLPVSRGPGGRMGVRMDGFADGAVFDRPISRIVPFASGGVIDHGVTRFADGGLLSAMKDDISIPSAARETEIPQERITAPSGDGQMGAQLGNMIGLLEKIAEKKSSTNVGVLLDKKIVEDWADSQDGERKIVKIMARNKQVLR